jgi:hypothetical protein
MGRNAAVNTKKRNYFIRGLTEREMNGEEVFNKLA